MEMQILDNKVQGRVIDKLRENIKSGTRLSIISAYFTIYAYEELRKELGKIEKLRLLFSEPTFVKNKKDINREFKLSGSYERGLAGDRYEMKLKNELKQSEIAKECANWIREKVEVRAYDEEYPLPQKMYLMENKKDESACIFGSSDFTSSGLGLVPSKKLEANTYIKDSIYTQQLLNQFELYWNDKDKVKDVKTYLLKSLEEVYKENNPEFIYFVTLYNIFKDYLNDLSEEDIIKTKTGFKESVVWNKLYNFQKDGVLGAIDKLEKYHGCILADSVGLGKTFEALAVIKYYESRNSRVLVLCPKKLRENWLTYKGNRRDNILERDRLNYDVLNHTDLSRYSGYSGEINLEKIYWENYDLIVIDESHNFRNNNNKRDDKETRYSRLLNQIIKKGVKTKVLMLSATPVNNRMTDLKNQIAFATEGNEFALADYGIKSIDQTLRKAQLVFNKWNELPEERKNLETLLEMLETDYFKLLDMLTIARSRKHIQKYYDTTHIGKFPERLKPINIKNDIDTQNDFIDLDELNKLIRALNLAIYSPMKYILPSKIAEYSKKYDTKTGKSVFRQIDRETSLIHLMRINILKRMESSIHSFGITISKILKNIDITLEKLNKSQDIEENLDIDDLELDDPRLDSVMIGSKNVKVFIQDIDKIKWRAELEGDRAILERIKIEAFKIQPHRDKKLEELKELIREKVKNPINEGNKKVITFTAFANTAKYLYDNIADWGLEELGLYSAVITGSDNPKTNLKGVKGEFNNILVNFSPKSKGREITDRAEIDILIATDCISEGQNLQDCDYLINYDIHWNPVRIIQRFGRVDRIGSKNEVIQLVNFWPNMELDEYINLEARVSGRMIMLDMSATGEENVIVDSGEMNDLEYRKKQLKQLQDQVVDLEDIGGGISITDLTFNDFKMDLVNYMKNNKEILEKAPTGMYAVAKSNIEEAERGVIFCLKQINEEIKPSEFNTLNPYFLVYVKESGEVLLNFIQSKKILDIYKKVCLGENTLFPDLISEFNRETNNAKDMSKFTNFLEKTVENIVGKEEEKGLDSLFSFGETVLNNSVQNMDDFELISFLVIK
ncbi:DEAD/DEAH box helicase family protein [Fusobacterium mortiferum]|uniref:helicase-related protein n=1 Tax=Fusobacterium mortiferum TaxID=850 RepID=UPI001F3A1E64|nr:helicase-related protein [Fusobacterium mortiferum]MCF2626661.1 DEAD/DEAH box helicase family protein [Fusobacterium mortiferum]MCF2698315.1 DEAD/DEAH box helicase family protein [Fusobacterium mortiferum]MCI7665117.1 SNF2-related protein [Fusobacterium mortiferum]